MLFRSGGTLVLLPIGAATETVAADSADTTAGDAKLPRRLADVYATDGLGGLANEVQGLLDLSFVAVGALEAHEAEAVRAEVFHQAQQSLR